jgi:small subunit ribosomal protein S1
MVEEKGKKPMDSKAKGGEERGKPLAQKRPFRSREGPASTDRTKRRPSSPETREPKKPVREKVEKKEKLEKPEKVERVEKIEKVEIKPPEEKKIVPKVSLAEIADREYGPEEYEKFLLMYEKTMPEMQEGELTKGRVMGVTKEDVIVDVGFKSEGIIPLSEFPQPLNIKVGDEIDVLVEAVEDQDGQLVLSKQKADFMMVWDKIKETYEQGSVIEGIVERRIKGGMVVDVLGVDAFLPGSQIALRQLPDFEALVGQKMELRIIKLNKSRRNIVVSRRAVLEEEREKQKSQLLAEVAPDQIREGIVKNITDFGVFIDLGGVDGLLHITDMSWGRISHPSELVALSDKIKVKIIDFDKKTGRISLGLKQLTPYPWENIEQRYPIGKRVRGKVVSITDYGAFVELEKGIEGLIHISEMSWTKHIKHPSKVVAIGDMVDAVVLSVDKENEKISLGIKQTEPDPWESIEQRYPVGSKVMGKVRNLTAFGVFLELEEGIDGLIHISDLSWTKRIQHPSEIVKKGDKIEVVVLHVDKENRRISLGFKQIKPDPWPYLSKKYALNVETTGKIIRMTDKGVMVELEDEMDGFVLTNQLGKPDITKPVEAFSEGEILPMRVTELDRPGRRIVLSVSAYYEGREKAELEAFLSKHPTKTLKVEEMVEEVPRIDFGKKEQKKVETEVLPESTSRVQPDENKPEEKSQTEIQALSEEKEKPEVLPPPAEEEKPPGE